MIDPKYAAIVSDALRGCAKEHEDTFSLSSWMLEGARIIDGQMQELEQQLRPVPPHMSEADAVKELRSMVDAQTRALADKENELRRFSDRFDESLAQWRRTRVQLQAENDSLTTERDVMIINAQDYRATIDKLTAARNEIYAQVGRAMRDGESAGMRKIQEEHAPCLSQAIALNQQACLILDSLRLSTSGSAMKSSNADGEPFSPIDVEQTAGKSGPHQSCECALCVEKRKLMGGR